MDNLIEFEAFGELSKAELIDLESRLIVNLPDDYVEFISKTNGGYSSNGDLVIHIPETNDELIINFLLGINSNENFDIIGWNEEYRIEMPNSTFIFGIEIGGGKFIYITEGQDKGVYFWDSNHSLESSEIDENVYFLAASFEEFLSLIMFES